MSIKMENQAKMDEDENCYQVSDEDDFLEDDPSLQDDEELASTSKENDTDSAGLFRGPYEKAWTGDATRALIHIRGPMEDKFNEGRQKRTTLWLYVTKQLHRLGFRYSAAKVQKKWHNILITYNKNISKKEEAGYVHWEFFEDMYKYLKGRRAVYDQRQVSDFSSNQIKSSGGLQEQHQQFLQQRLHQQQRMQEQQHRLMQQQRLQQQRMQSAIIKKDYSNSKTTTASSSNGHHSNDDVLDDDDEDPLESKYYPPSGNLPLQISHVVGGDGEESIHSTGSGGKKDLNDLSEDSVWWKHHFEKKLHSEREKIKLQREMHRDLMNFNRMALMQQEKIERIKIDAINSLTSTLQKLVESKNNINSIRK